jgi:hypothetical protein
VRTHLYDPVNTKLLDTSLSISSFGVDEENELYICDLNGKIYKLIATADATLPSISTPVNMPLEPTPDQEVTITVEVTDSSGVQMVILSYNDNGEYTNVTMSLITGNTYSADIPSMPDETEVRYRIIATDNLGNVAENDNLGLLYNYTVIPEFPSATIFALTFITATYARTVAVTWTVKKKHDTNNK